MRSITASLGLSSLRTSQLPALQRPASWDSQGTENNVDIDVTTPGLVIRILRHFVVALAAILGPLS